MFSESACTISFILSDQYDYSYFSTSESGQTKRYSKRLEESATSKEHHTSPVDISSILHNWMWLKLQSRSMR